MRKIAGVKEIRLSLVAEKPDTKPDALLIVALGVEKTGEWRSAELAPFSYVAAPKDGFWEFDFTLTERSSTPTDVITPIFAIHVWRDFPADDLKGITIHGEHNSLRKEISASFIKKNMKQLVSDSFRELKGGTDPWILIREGDNDNGDVPFPWLWGDDPFPW